MDEDAKYHTGEAKALGQYVGFQVEGKKVVLEQQYVSMLEQRVSQLQKLVEPLTTRETNDDPCGDEDEALSTKESTATSTSIAPLTEDNLAKVDGGTKKVIHAESKDIARVRQVVSIYNRKSGSRDEVSIEKKAKDEAAESQCLLRTVMDAASPKRVSRNEIEIGPGALLGLLKEIMVLDETDQASAGQHVTLATPFTSLVYKWDKLVEEVETHRAEDTTERAEARADLAEVLGFVQCSQDLESYFKTRQSNRNSAVINYDYLWTIFPVGTEVIASTFLEDQQIMIVGFPPYSIPNDKSQFLSCWYYDHDGTKWTAVEVDFEVDRFPGTKPIDTLPCIPLEYYKRNDRDIDLAQLRAGFVERGKAFKRYCTANPGVQQTFDYEGQLLTVERPFRSQYSTYSTDDRISYQSSLDNKPDPNSFKRASVDGQILVDPKSFLEYASVGLALGDLETTDIESKEKRYDIPEDSKCLIAPPRVLGWSTVRKMWCQFFVNKIRPAKAANQNVFEVELQLDAKIKKMIKALVEQHNNKKAIEVVKNPDLIEGKGRGLVILLHGPPGVGKTLTAEAISEKTSRPLLIVSVAEIGLDASKAERNLERLFQLASRWEAILLVDEADVFLESRVSQADPNRNALVSVLLRVLEYYQGIMILTTNRITSLDVAVQSRIHLAVRFEDLTQTQMRSILATILKKFNVTESGVEKILENFKEYLKDNTRLRFNGRQIRNIVFSAHAMALSEGRSSIGWSDMREVIRVTREFQDQLQSISDEQRYLREAGKGAERR